MLMIHVLEMSVVSLVFCFEIEVAGIPSSFLHDEQVWTDRFNFVERKI